MWVAYYYALAPLAALLVYEIRSRLNAKRLPPGPRPLPIIGNLLDVPSEAAWKVYAEWGKKKYGDIIYFKVLQKSVIVINSATVAHDLLDKRSAIYSSRPWVPMAGNVIGWNWALPLVTYGETFRRHRRYLQRYFAKPLLPDYYHIQLKEARRMINDILEDPDNYKRHIERMAGAIIMEIVFGHEVKSTDDKFLQIASKGGKTIAAAGAVGAHLVDLFPLLRFIPDWFPGTGFKRLPPGTREDLAAMRNVAFEYVKEKMAKGIARPCYTSTLLEETNFADEEGVRDTGANVYSAGFDTTLSALMSAMIALVLDPVIQARAQAELDTVIGKNRLPDFTDRESLPYIQCIIMEAFRWGATTPVGVPHCLTQDDEYNGYFLPEGSTIVANAWAMLHDPAVYPDPETFNPDRFLKGEGRTPQPDPRGPAFGFGRRACPGKDIAENTIWITIVSIFYAFKLTPAVDENGVEIPIDRQLSEHSVRHPPPFKCTIRPRLTNSETLVRHGQD
ncbi:cytochrome P450 [Fomitiporia mediterranea MF3/22]|uniref:cytochrome P450 n=1 Tax=Fomitiporia mediterranea (strain MF3/22) TaxID=694068 RepID=UPI0004408A48|nr:cytochrome P450 [Fomitiporia mediterranea MF3/22]EJD00109.1 cytochrome P450 [Fomitiporia mediterranea MF3/22]